MEGSAAIFALLGTIFGGAGLKIVEALLLRKKDKDTTATDLRQELREEVRYLREQLKAAEDELDEQRQKHLSVMQEYLDVQSKLNGLLIDFKQEASKGE